MNITVTSKDIEKMINAVSTHKSVTGVISQLYGTSIEDSKLLWKTVKKSELFNPLSSTKSINVNLNDVKNPGTAEAIEMLENELKSLELADTTDKIKTDISDTDDDKISFIGSYDYNKETDKYIVPLKSTGKTAVIEGYVHKGILQAYTGLSGDEESLNALAMKYGFTRAALKEYVKIMGWTHDSTPITDEQVQNQTEEQIVEELKQAKKFSIYNKFTKEDWTDTLKDALKWREFKTKTLDPMEHFLANFKPEPIPVLERPTIIPNVVDRALLIGVSDIHVGGVADAEEMFSGQGYNTDRAINIMEAYGDKVVQEVEQRGYHINTGVICILGDILHTLSGFTSKGTELEFDVIGEKQFDAALQSLIKFIAKMAAIFPVLHVEAVRGNHAGLEEALLVKTLAIYFRNNPDIKFNCAKSRSSMFKILNSIVIIDHGESDSYKAKTPASGNALEAYIQRLLLTKPEMLQGVTSKLFIQGDRHHFEHISYSSFDFFMFGTTMHDKFADHLNLTARRQQNCLLLDNTGVTETLHYYFD